MRAVVQPCLKLCMGTTTVALLQACEFMSEVGVPLYITETGVPDAKDVLRTEMFTTYFDQVKMQLLTYHHSIFKMFWAEEILLMLSYIQRQLYVQRGKLKKQR